MLRALLGMEQDGGSGGRIAYSREIPSALGALHLTTGVVADYALQRYANHVQKEYHPKIRIGAVSVALDRILPAIIGAGGPSCAGQAQEGGPPDELRATASKSWGPIRRYHEAT